VCVFVVCVLCVCVFQVCVCVDLRFRRIYRGDFRDLVSRTISALGGSQMQGKG